MSLSFEQLEKRIQTLIEGNLMDYLPGRTIEERIVQQLANAMRTNSQTDRLGKTAPDIYTIVVHPESAEQWEKSPALLDGLAIVLRTVSNEVGLRLNNDPTISIAKDASLTNDEIRVMASHRVAKLADTQNMESGEGSINNEIPKNAFLIIGGVKVFPLNQVVINIGRRTDNHLVLDDPRISRYHSQIRVIKGRFVIFDLNSTGGTYVNGQRASQTVLYPGDVISLAGLPVIFGQDNPPPFANAGDTSPVSAASSERPTAILRQMPEDPTTKK